MRLVPTRRAIALTGLSSVTLREWTSRRALIPADVAAKKRGSSASFGWQTILLLRLAVAMRDRFHLELQANKELFASIRCSMSKQSFIALWGKSLIVFDAKRWCLLDDLSQLGSDDDAVLIIRLDPHLSVLANGFDLSRPATGQLDLFPALAVQDRTYKEDNGQSDAAVQSGRVRLSADDEDGRRPTRRSAGTQSRRSA